ncbi:MAG: leucyl aminopeptidase [Candidatus Thioglobus sp.]|nr:MAG: leucyl aminopeptidase [Candidatus Thioglobus sp.]
MEFKINKEAKSAQTKVVFDKTAKLNEVHFTGNNQLNIGLGKEYPNAKTLKKLAITLAQTANKLSLPALFLPTLQVDNFVEIVVLAMADFDYQVQKIALPKPEANPLQSVTFAAGLQTDINKALAIADGMALARTLGDMPPNICTPTFLAKTAQDLAQEFGLESEILQEDDMQKLGMNSLLSVSKGSAEAPKLISLSYSGNGNSQPIVLLGKGVTFDSGGISLKTGNKMDEMKYDMCGAAGVLGTMLAVAKMQLKVNLTVVLAAVENMPAHNASKPGDVVQSMSGQTIEILNTDAEGRLILCDALTWIAKFNPKVVIDTATLTGAVITALGKHRCAVMTNEQNLADDLLKAGEIAQDLAWQLPLDDEYDELLKSNFADIANIGGRAAGTITAACFLARFCQDYRWAHIDIAGTAWIGGNKKGATGRPVPLLTQYVIGQSE